MNTANGSTWLWWWIAASHSELYVNLATLPQALLLGLAVGAVARDLGAKKRWPLAALLTLLTPVVARFVGAQYVDILLGALLLSAFFFGRRWAERARWRDGLLLSISAGMAIGTKALGLPYTGCLLLALLLMTRGSWKRRAPQLLAGAAILSLMGGYFYLRNALMGLGPLFPAPTPGLALGGVVCDPSVRHPLGLPPFDQLTVAAKLWPMLANGSLTAALLGTTSAGALEMGIGPQGLLLLLAMVALPFLIARRHRPAALVMLSQVVAQIAIWFTVPVAFPTYIFANVRYLMAPIAFCFAAGVALLEQRKVSKRIIAILAAILAAQSLLQLHAELPHGLRVALAFFDLLLVGLLLRSPAKPRWWRGRPGWIAAGVAAMLIALAPLLADFRAEDRYRAFEKEFTVHATPVAAMAKAWAWLAAHGGRGKVATAASPMLEFAYPAMGMRFEREVVYVNVNAQDQRDLTKYENCDPRVNFDPRAWLRNLRRQEVRWVLLSRLPALAFPPEDLMARLMPRALRLRYEDANNRIYQLVAGQGAKPD